MSVQRAVQRLTSEIGDWLGVDAGTLAPGRRADVVVIDPEALDDQVEAIHEEPLPGFGLSRLVRRNDAAVRHVLVNGRVASRGGRPDPALGQAQGFGAVLRAA
jgi:N-acyl-D-aspartate/D-glutamate deacylase